MLKEFKEFAVKGNVIDMAVGIIIGAAFTTLVKSLVEDIITPPMGLLTSGLDFADRYIILKAGNASGPFATLADAKASGAVIVSYGTFINNILSFLLVGIVLFFIVRWMNRLRSPDTPPAPNTKICSYCKSTIDASAVLCPFCTSSLES